MDINKICFNPQLYKHKTSKISYKKLQKIKVNTPDIYVAFYNNYDSKNNRTRKNYPI